MSNLIGSSNADYHANSTHLSSSGIKHILKDAAGFHRKYILKTEPQEHKAVFDEGSYTHTLCLEPEKVGEYAIFNGLRKAGGAFEEFKAANKGKIILSIPQELRCRQFHAAYQARAEAVKMLSGGLPEFTMLGEVLGIPVKSRADYINIDAGYIVDVKTTSLPSEMEIFSNTVKEFSYDLSAALYAEIAHQNFKKLFDFYWIVISKSDLTCDIYKASSETLSLGFSQVQQALVKYKKCKDSGLWVDEHPKPSYDSKNYEIKEV